jgi:hypothetical protein
MPIPKPNSGESQSDFVSRCMSAMSGENRPEDQKLAICYAQYRKSVGNNVTKADLLNELMFEKRRLAAIIEDAGSERIEGSTDQYTK